MQSVVSLIIVYVYSDLQLPSKTSLDARLLTVFPAVISLGLHGIFLWILLIQLTCRVGLLSSAPYGQFHFYTTLLVGELNHLLWHLA